MPSQFTFRRRNLRFVAYYLFSISLLGILGCSKKATEPNNNIRVVQDLAFTAEYWEGAGWCGNNYDGTWFPSVSNGEALFSHGDYCWGQIRTEQALQIGDEISFEIDPSLTSGGENYDAALFGIGDAWAYYQGRFIGLVFYQGKLYFWDTQTGVFDIGRSTLIGSYTAGAWATIHLKYRDPQTLAASGTGISGSITFTGMSGTLRFLCVIKDSQDGMRVRNCQIVRSKP